ncbi:unnamed protein product [Rodentolepis nana]|uniref:KH domain-containing protein n=1 Tax=Rodentolepis nana TaxID=102285 RepID=A0A0R3T3I3_RODNA|nr:unnamed protein product [Rodentolepis nana]
MCPSGVDCEAVLPLASISRKIKQEDLVENSNSRWNYDPDKSVSLRFLMSRRCGAKIKISDKGVKERVVFISGSIAAVVRVIRRLCREFAWVSSDYVDVENASNIPKFVFRMLLPASLCGHLIGQQGECIHKLRQITGSLVKITRQKLPNSTERILFIYGTVTSITACLEMICALLGEVKNQSHEIPYIPATEPFNPSRLYSKVPLSFPWNMKFATSVLSKPWLFRDRRWKSNVGYWLSRIDCRFNRKVLNDILPSHAQLNSGPQVRPLLTSSAISPPTTSQLSPMAQPHPSVALSANCFCPASLISNILLVASHFAEDVVRRELLIANDLIGCVIGRGGMKINEIRKVSQATIHISNDENSLQQHHRSRLITITGSPKAVDSAVDMINASLQCREATLMPSEITQPIL